MNLKFDVTGMTCAACSARVEKVTAAVPGVDQVEVNLLAGTMQVKTENESCTEAIISAVQNAGYGAAVHGQSVAKAEIKNAVQDELRQMKVRIISSLVFLLRHISQSYLNTIFIASINIHTNYFPTIAFAIKFFL